MVYIIVKPTRREREANLAESCTRSVQRGIRGVVRTTEEAHDMQRQHEREGEEFTRPYAVSAGAAESQKAEAEVLLRAGINPETMQKLHTYSTEHGPPDGTGR